MIRFTKDHRLFQNHFVLSGTGSRSFLQDRDPMLLDLCCLTVESLMEHNPGRPFLIVSGGAQGWDRYLTKVAVKMQIPFALVISSPEYPSYYYSRRGSLDHRDHMEDWDAMEKRAVEVLYVMSSFIGSNNRAGGANFDRNAALVDVGDHFLVWNANSATGTGNCLRLIRAAKKPYTDMIKEYGECSPRRSA